MQSQFQSQTAVARTPSTWLVVLATVVAFVGIGVSAGAAADTSGEDTVFATVGSHRITQQQVDDQVMRNVSPSQLYDLRKRALDKLIDDYLVEQAAKKAGLTADQYLAKETAQPQVTDAEARKFYDDHRAAIDQQIHGQSFDQIKGRIILALEHQGARQSDEALITKLRAESGVKEMLEPPRVSVASAGHPWAGGKDASVTVVEFSDFQCPYCRAAETSVKQLQAKYGDKIKLVYLDFPLGFHEHAMDAARAAQCAAAQNKFWPYHDALFADQSKLAPADLKATAARVGLDSQQFNACFDKGTPDDVIRSSQAQGQSLGVTGTPTFFINGRMLTGAQPLDKFSAIIDDELASAKAPTAQQAKAD
jgi:protein-disulfide isomerase